MNVSNACLLRLVLSATVLFATESAPDARAQGFPTRCRGEMPHTRGKPYHPMTQGKIERWHLSLKSRILLENYYLPGDLERAVAAFVEHYNHCRYHESLDNLTPADVYFVRDQRIRDTRREIKRRTIAERRRLQLRQSSMKPTR